MPDTPARCGHERFGPFGHCDQSACYNYHHKCRNEDEHTKTTEGKNMREEDGKKL